MRRRKPALVLLAASAALLLTACASSQREAMTTAPDRTAWWAEAVVIGPPPPARYCHDSRLLPIPPRFSEGEKVVVWIPREPQAVAHLRECVRTTTRKLSVSWQTDTGRGLLFSGIAQCMRQRGIEVEEKTMHLIPGRAHC